MPPRGTDIIWPFTAAKGCLRRNKHLVAAALDCAPQNLLGLTIRIDVGRIEKIQASLQTDIDQSRCLFDTRRPPRSEEFVAATKSAGAKTKRRNFKARASKSSIFHFCSHVCFGCV